MGIIGLIGWAYLLCAEIYQLAGRKLWTVIVAFILLLLLNVQEFNRIPGWPQIRIVVSASNHVLVMAGILASVLYIKLTRRNQQGWFITGLLLLAVFTLLFGFATRPYWGIS